MTEEQSTLLKLIRASLWGEAVPDHAEEALEEAKKQALVPLLYPGSAEAMRYSAHHIRILYAQDRLTELMRAAEIPAVILKGAAAAVYYPDPFLRTMGDVDFIVPADRFSAAADLLAAHGYAAALEAHSLERHATYQKDGIALEMHVRFSSEGIDVEQYVREGMMHPVTANLEGHCFEMLPPLENGLVLLAHAAQHLKKDLGMRQILDWMMYVDESPQALRRPEHVGACGACGGFRLTWKDRSVRTSLSGAATSAHLYFLPDMIK